MNKPALKNFAISARLELLARVRDRAAFYGITEEKYRDKAIVPTKSFQRLDGVMLSSREAQQRNDLLARIRGKGYEQVMEEAAYTWFNRFIALRYMEEHRLLPMDARVLPEQPGLLPQLVREAQRVELDGIDRAEITAMLEENRTEELYKTLLIALCNQLSGPLPQMFEPIADYTELLFPDGILKAESVLGMLAALNRPGEDNWGDIQVIGWLYQYYNTELKQETFDLLKKNVKITKERIGAATQLFTPEWIVNYMVENSLGRLWLEGHPDHNIQDQWRYYLEEAKQEPEVEAKLAEIRRERASLQPEQITVLDPCMGSGHILVYAFDVLMTIYRAVGYTDRDAVQSIIENNLYGLDIDDRAAQLAYFALMMKACQYDRRFLRRGIQPHVCPIEPSQNIFAEDLACFGPLKQQALDLYHTFTDAKEYGSILTVPLTAEELRQLSDACDDLLQQAKTNISFEIAAVQKSCAQAIRALIPQAMILARKYDAVITNPPYAGAKGLNSKMHSFISAYYPIAKADMFATFIIKTENLLMSNGICAMITPSAWLYNPSYTALRKHILYSQTIINLLELGSNAFEVGFGTTMFVYSNNIELMKYYGLYADVKKELDSNNILQSLQGIQFNHNPMSFFLQYENFKFSYKLNDSYRKVIFRGTPLSSFGSPRAGLQTDDNARFIREWFEVVKPKISFNHRKGDSFGIEKWFPHIKGGTYRKWYGNVSSIVNWQNGGKEIKENAINKYGSYTKRVQSMEYYFCQGIAWTHTTYTQPFACRFLPKGFISNVEGPVIFDLGVHEYYILGLLNSKIMDAIFTKMSDSIHYLAGEIARFPVIIDECVSVNETCVMCIEISKKDWDSFETSWDFQRHPLI